MQIVTGYRGQAHITSNDDQGRNQGVFGQNSYVLSVGSQFAPTLVSANELRIADGEAVMQGVHFRVDPSSFDSVTITNGTQGMNRKDLVVCRYTKDGSTGVENCEWVVIEGTPTSGTAARPSAVSGDILDGALVADMPFFEIVLSGINVTAVNSLFSKLMTMQEIQALAKTNESGISELNSKITTYTTLTSETHTIVGRYMKIGYLIIVSGNFTYKSGVFNVETNLPAPYSAVPFVIRNSTTGSMGTAFFESNHLSTYLTSATLNDGNTVRFTFSYIANQV